ncbi:all3515 family Zur-repressed PEP-CTERM protein [Aphanothece sacrum]|nr:all3515 family Zur-repressed PEP-CTERM protein [Aphanothece sacrum]
MNLLKTTTNILLGSPVVALSLLSSSQITLAQVHFGHHHMVVGRDSLEILMGDTNPYAGLPNPNYNRLSLLFPHPHEPPELSHFHGIGIYSYTGDVSSPTILNTNTNNQLPEIRFNLPPLPLVPGTGAFKGKMVSIKTEDNIFSDLTTKPVAHLASAADPLSPDYDPYIAGVYHTSNDRWNGLLGDDATIYWELVNITPGLKVADSNGQTLLSKVGDKTFIGKGDNFAFKPYFYAPKMSIDKNYSATLKFVDINEDNGRTPWLESGEFTINFQAESVPEPLTILGVGTALGFGSFFKRKLGQKKK